MTLFKRKNGMYYVSFFENKKQKVISTKCKDKPSALKFVTNLKQNLKERSELDCEPITLKKLVFEYLKFNEPLKTSKTLRTYRGSFKFFQQYFGEQLQLSEIDFKKLSDYFNYRLRTASVYQARIDKINLSSLYEFALERMYIKENIVKRIKPFRIPEKQPAYFTPEQFSKWLDACDKEDIRDVSIVAIYTGMRLTELVNLRWNEVDFRNRMIILSNQNTITKSKKVRTIPMSIGLMQKMTDLQQHSKSDRVFAFNTSGNVQDYITKQFKKIVRKAGINGKLHFHSLRHSFASALVESGVGIYQVSKMLGHSTTKTTEVYAHIRPESLLQLVESLNF